VTFWIWAGPLFVLLMAFIASAALNFNENIIAINITWNWIILTLVFVNCEGNIFVIIGVG
jgi:hypothetical protein